MSYQELEAYLARAQVKQLVDQQIRSVDVGKSHVAIGLVQRGTLAAPGPDSAHRALSRAPLGSNRAG